MKTGILGGTFDPPHMGHIFLAQNAKKQLSLDRIVLLPSANPPHKKTNTAGHHRLAMAELVAKEYGFELCDAEYKKETPSYTVEIIDELKKIYPGEKLFFIIGGDSMMCFEKWYKWQELIKKCAFVAGIRSEGEKEILEKLAEEKNREYQGEIYILDSPAHEVSSTEIRNGENSEEIPPCIINYIKEHSLYEGLII